MVDKHLRGHGPPPLEYVEYAICKKMGWTYAELEAQPAIRVHQIITFMQREKFYEKSLEPAD